MKFYIQKLSIDSTIEKYVEKGEDVMFFLGNSFSLSLPYTQEVKSGKNKGKITEMVESLYFSYFLDFDLYEKKLHLTFEITPIDDETQSFCFFNKVNQSMKSFDKKTVKFAKKSDSFVFKESYRRRLSSDTDDIQYEINDFLRNEMIDSIEMLSRRIKNNKLISFYDDSLFRLDEEIKTFKKYANIFIDEKIPKQFSEYIDLYHIDYNKQKLEKNLHDKNEKIKKIKI